jgi:hypothetical protein
MRQVGIDRAKFRIPHNHLTFEGVFLADCTPWQLGLACLAHNFALLFEVSRSYEIATYIHDAQALNSLRAALRTDADSGRGFSTSDFLREIDARLPATVTPGDRPRPVDMAPHRRDVEEADRIYLCGWDPHASDGRHVSARNLAKTRAWLGQAQHDWCERYNVSTRWTDDPRRALLTLDRPNWKGYE